MPYLQVDDLNLYYEIHGKGDPILCISGLGGDTLSWNFAQVPTFTEAGFQAIVFDNRDAGLTGTGQRTSYTIARMAEDTAELIRALALPPVHVIGLSMGGMIGQELALASPELIRSLTLGCTYARPDARSRHTLQGWAQAKQQCQPTTFADLFWPWMFTHRFFDNTPALEQLLRMATHHPYPQPADAFARQVQAIDTHDTLDRLDRIKAPTHVMVAEEDILTPPRYAQQLAEAIPEAQLTVMPHAGHCFFLEDAEAFNRSALAFISQH